MFLKEILERIYETFHMYVANEGGGIEGEIPWVFHIYIYRAT